LNNNKLINPKLICAFYWIVLFLKHPVFIRIKIKSGDEMLESCVISQKKSKSSNRCATVSV